MFFGSALPPIHLGDRDVGNRSQKNMNPIFNSFELYVPSATFSITGFFFSSHGGAAPLAGKLTTEKLNKKVYCTTHRWRVSRGGRISPIVGRVDGGLSPAGAYPQDVRSFLTFPPSLLCLTRRRREGAARCTTPEKRCSRCWEFGTLKEK